MSNEKSQKCQQFDSFWDISQNSGNCWDHLLCFLRHVVLCDPMLATGGSALTAIEAGDPWPWNQISNLKNTRLFQRVLGCLGRTRRAQTWWQVLKKAGVKEDLFFLFLHCSAFEFTLPAKTKFAKSPSSAGEHYVYQRCLLP